MASKRAVPPRWLFFILGVGALLASGIFIGIARTSGLTTGGIVRIVLFGLLGIRWVFQFGTRAAGENHS